MQIIDYIVFFVTFMLSIGMGMFFWMRSMLSKQNEIKSKTTEYLVASNSMNILPLTLSLFATMISSASIIGNPVEVYTYGAQYWISFITICCAPLIGAFVTGPLFYLLKLLSVF